MPQQCTALLSDIQIATQTKNKLLVVKLFNYLFIITSFLFSKSPFMKFIIYFIKLSVFNYRYLPSFSLSLRSIPMFNDVAFDIYQFIFLFLLTGKYAINSLSLSLAYVSLYILLICFKMLL